MTARKTWANGERLTSSDLNGMFLAPAERLGHYVADNLAASASDVATGYVNVADTQGHKQPVSYRAGTIIGLVWRLSGAIAAGTIDLRTRIGGAASVSALVLDSGSGTSGSIILGAPRSFGANNNLAVNYTTSGTLSPSGSIDLAVDLLTLVDRP